MNVGKKIISLICLSSMMLGFNSSSRKAIAGNLNLRSLDVQDKETKLEEDKLKELKHKEEERKIAQIELEKAEVKRVQNVTYIRDNVTEVSGVTKEELEEVFMNTTSSSTMVHLAGAFVEAEETYGVNAFFLAGVVALESGFATSRRAIEDNNLTGYEVYSEDSEGRLFPSQTESILHTARHLRKNYLTQDALYYNGLSVDAIQIMYCPDEGKNKQWEKKVDNIANKFLNTYTEKFKIGFEEEAM